MGPPNPIAIPRNPPPSFPVPQHYNGPPSQSGQDDVAAQLDRIPNAYDPFDNRSPEEAQKDLRDLMSGVMEDENADEDDDEDIPIKGWNDEFTLQPHQKQARKWMREREDPDKKRYGGILADDMG